MSPTAWKLSPFRFAVVASAVTAALYFAHFVWLGLGALQAAVAPLLRVAL